MRELGQKISVVETHPYLVDDFYLTLNAGVYLRLLVYGSHKKICWKCRDCGHVWKTELRCRAVRGTGCPACSGRVATPKNNLKVVRPDLVSWWDFELNEKGPEEYTKCSGKKVWWVCKDCGDRWRATISHRVNNTGCPYCSGHIPNKDNNLNVKFPKLVSMWWNFEKNIVKPEEVTPFSGKRAQWGCAKGHSWEAVIKNVTRNKNGCPVCAGQVVTKENCLKCVNPELSLEWDYGNNEKGPEEVMEFSNYRAGWKCLDCGHRWESLVYSRSCGRGCPKCAQGRISKVSQTWLDALNISTREYYIKDLNIYVDGLDSETNTVYEFLGDYWHGNPKKYLVKKINPTNKKSFGQLYQDTVNRFRLLKANGYKIKYVWEDDYNKGMMFSEDIK